MSKTLIIGIAGEIHSGKTTIARALASDFGFVHFENSDVLKEILESVGVLANRDNMYSVAQAMFGLLGKDILAKGWISKASEMDGEDLVVSGIRYPEELDVYLQYGKFKLVYVECPSLIREERIKVSEGIGSSALESYMESEAYHDVLKSRADHVINNSGALSDLTCSIRSIISK